MNIPIYPAAKAVDQDQYLTRPWQTLFDNLLQNLQSALGAKGFQISIVSSDPNSVNPSTPGGQLAQVQATFGQQNGVIAGTVVFDPYEQNGAVLPSRNGQLKVLLADGQFHKITNT